MIRAAVVLLGGTVLTAIYASRVVMRDLLGLHPKSKAESCDCLASTWCRLLLRLSGVRVHLHGEDRVDWSRPAVVVANHQSWYDVFSMTGYLPGHPRFVAKEELGRIPIFGRAWKTCGHISLNRSNRRRAIESLDNAAARVREEALTVVLFPEGTRSPDGKLHAFKKGAFVLAIKTGVPIIPIGISGSGQVMPKGSWRVSPGDIHIRIGDPIPVEGLSHGDRERLRERSRAAVTDLMAAGGAGGGEKVADPPLESDPSLAGASGADETTTSESKETSE